MIFDLFHSLSDTLVGSSLLGPNKVFKNFLNQAMLAEELGFDTLWLAESHFSSETQKKTSVATIPQFQGEVGLNSDSYQWFHVLRNHTKKLNLGTGIHNIVGGSGGPIASADRANTLNFINQNLWSDSRTLRLGVAAGRFPYQNTCFGLVPRDEVERDLWGALKRYHFLEALEIFLRLLQGQSLASSQVARYELTAEEVKKALFEKWPKLEEKYSFPVAVRPRWDFEELKLVPEEASRENLRVVLGSHDPQALELGMKWWDLDLFNLSFTPPEQIDYLHKKLTKLCEGKERPWHRSRLPRTVLVFVDPDRKKAVALANQVIDTYIEAMRGTAQVPDKKILMERALVGDASEVREQLSPENPRRFHADDRLMLWFEFNQIDNDAICRQMTYFSEQVIAKL